MTILDWLRGKRRRPEYLADAATPADIKYQQAMSESGELLDKMREASRSTDAVRAVMADIWAQNHNVAFMTTVIETVQEMNAPLYQDRSEHK